MYRENDMIFFSIILSLFWFSTMVRIIYIGNDILMVFTLGINVCVFLLNFQDHKAPKKKNPTTADDLQPQNVLEGPQSQ